LRGGIPPADSPSPSRVSLALRDALGFARKFPESLASSRRHRREYPAFRVGDYKPKSGTLFIFGTGRSVLELGPSQWEIVKACDSFAMNQFCLHDFVTDIYSFEYIFHIPEHRKLWIDAIARRAKEGRLSPWVVTGDLTLDKLAGTVAEMREPVIEHLQGRLKRVGLLLASVRTPASLPLLRMLGRLLPSDTYIHVRGSAAVALDWGLRTGFRRIVFCGVDLDGRGHFFEPAGPGSGGATHLTNVSMFGLIPMAEYLRATAAAHPEVDMRTTSPSSRLAEFLPVLEWNALPGADRAG
jgi:hypothetical protein